MKTITKRALGLVLALTLLLGAAPGVLASSSGAAAPPSTFDVYVNVDGSTTPTLLKSYSSAEMRTMARKSRENYLADDSYEKVKDSGVIYYTAYSMSAQSGRVVTEYVMLSDLFNSLDVTFGESDYFIMGHDYTIDSQYQEYNFGSAQENYEKYWKDYGWYNYSDLCGERYYYQNWNAETKYAVPSVIALRSYGGSGWTEEGYWDMSAGSSDYLWAYVVNFGQTENDLNTWAYTYNRFYYQQDECTIKLDDEASANSVISGLLSDTVAEAKAELAAITVGTSANEVADGSYWVTQAQYNALNSAVTSYENVAGTNGEVYNAYLALEDALDTFDSAKKLGSKTGFAWFSPENYESTERYTISTVDQMAELAELVNGMAVIGNTMLSAYDFSGKTIVLNGNIDLERYDITIGDEDHPFAGTFDGGNYTLSNLRVVDRVADPAGYNALFGYNTGTIRNLTVSGSVTSKTTDKYVAGIVAYNSGSVENCVNEATVTAENADNVGGVVGCNEDGTVTDCLNLGTVTGCKDVGGIVGYQYSDKESSSPAISSCLNAGAISAAESSDNANVGGIAGGVGGEKNITMTIDSCINSGTVTTAGKTAGGIVGGGWISELTVSNCYSLGSVASALENASASDHNLGAILGRSKATVTNCLWLAGTADAGIGYNNNKNLTPPEASSAAELAAADLGEAFNAVENGYPVLKWQQVYTVGFDTDAQASIDAQSVGEYLTAFWPDDPEGYTISGCYADSGYTSAYTFNQLITGDTTIYVTLSEDSGSGPDDGSGSGGTATGAEYNISLSPDIDGIWTVTVPSTAKSGESVTVKVARANKAYTSSLAGIQVNGSTVSTLKNAARDAYGNVLSASLTFTMPEGDAVISVLAAYQPLTVSITTTGGSTTTKIVDRSDMEALASTDNVYYSGYNALCEPLIGRSDQYVTIERLLEYLGVTSYERISFTPIDNEGNASYIRTFTQEELEQTRYFYPGVTSGDESGAVELAPMLTIRAYQDTGSRVTQEAIGAASTDTLNTYRLVVGQTENDLDEKADVSFSYAKWVTEISVTGATVTDSSGDISGGGTIGANTDSAVQDGVLTIIVDNDAFKSAAQAAEPGTQMVIAPDEADLDGSEAVDTVIALVSRDALEAAASAGLSVQVDTPLGEISLPNRALASIASGSGETVTVTIRKTDGGAAVTVAVDGAELTSVDGGIRAAIPAAEGQVAALVNSDGTQTILPKSIVEDGVAYVLLDGSATIRIIDNAKDFTDVDDGVWYREAVDFASSHELVNGVGNGLFAPEGRMTRAMMVTVLYRLEGSPTVNGADPFADVASGAWYADAVIWASANGIVNGYSSEAFGPEDEITREQIAVILSRYAAYLGMDVSAGTDLSQFADGGQTSGWAVDAVQWAVSTGLLQGTGSALDPGGLASRAEVVTILARLVALLVR